MILHFQLFHSTFIQKTLEINENAHACQHAAVFNFVTCLREKSNSKQQLLKCWFRKIYLIQKTYQSLTALVFSGLFILKKSTAKECYLNMYTKVPH